MADKEFQAEVKQSLDRAFDEGHSTDNAAVELKTLRMASNVPLTRVKEAVVDAIVERIPLIDNDPAGQRKEIAQIVGRWGQLINLIGGVDPVETIAILQVSSTSFIPSWRFPFFTSAVYTSSWYVAPIWLNVPFLAKHHVRWAVAVVFVGDPYSGKHLRSIFTAGAC